MIEIVQDFQTMANFTDHSKLLLYVVLLSHPLSSQAHWLKLLRSTWVHYPTTEIADLS